MGDADASASASADTSCAATSFDTSTFTCSTDTNASHHASTNDSHNGHHHSSSNETHNAHHHSSNNYSSGDYSNDYMTKSTSFTPTYSYNPYDPTNPHYISSTDTGRNSNYFENFNMGARGPNNLHHQPNPQQKSGCTILKAILGSIVFGIAITVVIFYVLLI